LKKFKDKSWTCLIELFESKSSFPLLFIQLKIALFSLMMSKIIFFEVNIVREKVPKFLWLKRQKIFHGEFCKNPSCQEFILILNFYILFQSLASSNKNEIYIFIIAMTTG